MNRSKKPGVFNLDKPPGMTSREAVDHVEARYPGIKAGHAGTLDRAAEGVLPVLVNEATKLVPYLQKDLKTYRARIRFDRRSPSYDLDREYEEVNAGPEISRGDLAELLPNYRGTVMQVPPRYSAVQTGGVRAYKQVSQGEDPGLEARRVRVEQLQLLDFTYPTATLAIVCGKGFYVRSLVRDLAADLNQSGGVLSELIRTSYGCFSRDDAVAVTAADWDDAWQPPIKAVNSFQPIRLESERLTIIRNGGWIPRESQGSQWAALLDLSGHLYAVAEAVIHRDQPVWKPRRVMNRQDLEEINNQA